MASAMDDGCELRPGSREYRARDRQYHNTLRSLGGTRTAAGRAFVDAEHRQFRQTMANHAKHSGGCGCFRALMAGKRRLAIRLAQRWVKLQLGVLVVPA